jgi:hypothetical protein
MTCDAIATLRERAEGIQGEFYALSEYYRGDSELSLSDFHKAFDGEEANLFLPAFFTWGDYCGSSVEASNYRVFLDLYGKEPGVLSVYGGYDSHAIALTPDCINPEIWDTLAGLQDYPLISEDDHSALEGEWEDDAWEQYVGQDFRAELHKAFNGEEGENEEKIDAITDEDLFEMFLAEMESQNVYWVHEQCGTAWIDIADLVKDMDCPF